MTKYALFVLVSISLFGCDELGDVDNAGITMEDPGNEPQSSIVDSYDAQKLRNAGSAVDNEDRASTLTETATRPLLQEIKPADLSLRGPRLDVPVALAATLRTNLNMDGGMILNTRRIQMQDTDDGTGGLDNKYLLMARDGSFQFYQGGVVVGGFPNDTWEDVTNGHLIVSRKVAIGTPHVTNAALTVDGKILAEEIEVVANIADYVFTDSFNLTSLEETEQYIEENGHLPGIPSEEEVDLNGGKVSLGESYTQLLQKIEELTLHVIAQNKRIRELEKQ